MTTLYLRTLKTRFVETSCHQKILAMWYSYCVKSVPPKTQNQLDKPVCFTHANVLLSYANETVFTRKLPFFKILVNHFMAQDNSPCANVISKCMLWVRVPVSEF